MLPFSKYQGLGNDFLILDRRLDDGAGASDIDPCLVQRLCERRFGVGADGVILALPPRQGGELRMRIFNADGSEPEMCGNGIRCLARFLADSDGEMPGRRWQVETLAGLIIPELEDSGMVRVDMAAPLLQPEQVPTSFSIGSAGFPQGRIDLDGTSVEAGAVGMGNPHLVIPVEDAAAIPLEQLGPGLEHHRAFPAKTNVHLVQVLSPDHLLMRVWERGAGITLACGTGACATLVACHLMGLADRRARVDLPGGSLWIEWDEGSGHVLMTGPAEAVFDGVVAPHLLDPGATDIRDDLVEERVPTGASASDPNGRSRPPGAAGDPTAQSVSHADDGSTINCATACGNGCLRPDNCASAEARSRVAALLEGTSLDELVSLATQSIERRSRARMERPPAIGT